MASQATNEETPVTEPRRRPVVPRDLIAAKVGSKNCIYEAIKSGEIATFRLGGKIIISPAWIRENLDW